MLAIFTKEVARAKPYSVKTQCSSFRQAYGAAVIMPVSVKTTPNRFASDSWVRQKRF